MFASGCLKTSCLPFMTDRWDIVDFGKICGGRERDSEKTAHVGRITKIDCRLHCINQIYHWRWFKSHSSQAVRLAQYLLRDSSGVTLQNQTRSLRIYFYRRTVNKTTWSNLRYNTELFYFSVWAFETPNKQASIYHEWGMWTRVCLGVSSTQRELVMDLIK